MVTGDYRFDDSVADSTTSAVTTTAGHLGDDLTDLKSAVDGLAASWEGGEYDLYKGVVEGFHAAATNARESLSNIVKAVDGQKAATDDLKKAIRDALGG